MSSDDDESSRKIQEKEEDLDTSDPRDRRWRNTEGIFVISLVHTKRGEEAEGVDNGQVSAENLRPSLDAAIWRRTRCNLVSR